MGGTGLSGLALSDARGSFPGAYADVFYVANPVTGKIQGTADKPGWMKDGDLRSLITDGALAGMSGVLVFLPQILILFFFIGFDSNLNTIHGFKLKRLSFDSLENYVEILLVILFCSRFHRSLLLVTTTLCPFFKPGTIISLWPISTITAFFALSFWFR